MFFLLFWIPAIIMTVLQLCKVIAVSWLWMVGLYLAPIIVGLLGLVVVWYFGKKWSEAFYNNAQGQKTPTEENSVEREAQRQAAINKLIN